jgi:ribose transport system substrate-binding protein
MPFLACIFLGLEEQMRHKILILVTCILFLGSALVPVFAAGNDLPSAFNPAPGVKTIQYPAHKAPYKLALVNGFAGNAWRIQAIQTAKAWAARPENKKFISEFKVVSTGTDIAAQIAAIDNFIAAGYDGIVFIAVNPTAFDAVIKRAQKAGTVLVPFDNVLDTDRVCQVNQDVKAMGGLWAKYIVSHMKVKKGNLLEVRGLEGNATDRDRHLGALEYLKAYPDITVTEVVGNWDTATTQKVVADAIATHGKFDGIWVQYGAGGAINAVIDSKHPIVPIGGDPQNDVRTLMAKYKIPGGTTGQSPTISAAALQAAVYLLQGKTLPQLVLLESPELDNKDLKEGVNYFPNLPPTFTPAFNFKGVGFTFTVDEIVNQTSENQ